MVDHEKMENLLFMDEKQQYDVFQSVMNQMDNISDSDFFSYVQAFGVYCLKYISTDQMHLITDHLVNYILKRGIYFNQIIELCGFYIQFFDNVCQNKMFYAIMEISSDYVHAPKILISIAKFLREANKVLSKSQLHSCICFLETARSNVPTYLQDTIAYTIENMGKKFLSHKADVLLLVPEFLSGSSFLQPPICLIQAKSNLTKNGLIADLFDNRVYHYSIEQLIKIIGNHYKYIVVTSSPIDQYQAYFVDKRFVVFSETVNAIQRCCTYDKLIVCGSHGTVDYKMLLNDVSPDIILQGNYEHSLGRVIAELKNKSELSSIPNIVYREDNKNTNFRASARYIVSALEDSYIDYSLVNLNDYYGYCYIDNIHVLKRKWAILQNTTGCPYHCIFCYNIYGNKVKYKRIANVIKELQQLELQGCQEVFFIDQTFTINKEYTEALCQSIIDNNITIGWQCETRVDLLPESTLDLMKQAGCRSIWIGIESLDDEVLKKNKKGYTKDQLIHLLNLLQAKDISYSAFIMYGMYGDTVASLNYTADMIIKNKIKTSKSFIQCLPRPGTQLYMHLHHSIRNQVTHFWQIESLRNKFNDRLTPKDIDLVREKIINSRQRI